METVDGFQIVPALLLAIVEEMLEVFPVVLVGTLGTAFSLLREEESLNSFLDTNHSSCILHFSLRSVLIYFSWVIRLLPSLTLLQKSG